MDKTSKGMMMATKVALIPFALAMSFHLSYDGLMMVKHHCVTS
jgi:hypothetical protein